ncbi:MAG: ParA family protein [Saprospiraceae bacterium]|nr:ParA family protein [Saprospiraceae bacterium]
MIISSISYKGGVGKSTLAQNLAVALALDNHKVCIIDADEAAATTRWFAIRQEAQAEPFVNVVQMTEAKAIIPSVKALYKDYDAIIIDGPPSLFPIVSKIMLLSHIILIPIVPKGGSDYWVTEDFLVRYNEVQEEKEERTPAYFLLNMYKESFNLHKAVVAGLTNLGEQYGVHFLKSKLHERVAYGESNVKGVSVMEYTDPRAQKEIRSLMQEIVEIAQKS